MSVSATNPKEARLPGEDASHTEIYQTLVGNSPRRALMGTRLLNVTNLTSQLSFRKFTIIHFGL